MRLGLEIRAVNSRFLDLDFRLPEELRAQEPALRALLSSHLKRGKVEVRAAIRARCQRQPQHPQHRLAPAPATSCKTSSGLAAQRRKHSLWPMRCAWPATAPPQPRPIGPAFCRPLAEEAVTALLDARAREGKRLAERLLGSPRQLRELAAQATPLVPQLVEQQRQRFSERWQEAMGLTQGQVPAEAAQDAL